MSVYDILEPNLWVQIFYSNQLLVGWLVGWLLGADDFSSSICCRKEDEDG